MHTITGETVPREEALNIMAKFDRDHSGTIDRQEFEQMVLERMQGRSFQEETARAFKLLEDKDQPSFVTRESVRRVAQEVFFGVHLVPLTHTHTHTHTHCQAGEKLTEEELNEMFDTLVTGLSTGAVDYSSFCAIQYAAENMDK